MSHDVLARDEDAASVSDLWDLVDEVFPGSRPTRCRTPDDFMRYCAELTRRADARKRGETIAALRLEHLQERHGEVAMPGQHPKRCQSSPLVAALL
jgi:hypothetical protein